MGRRSSTLRKGWGATLGVAVVVASSAAPAGDRPAVVEPPSAAQSAQPSIPLPGGDIAQSKLAHAGGPQPTSQANTRLLDEPLSGRAAVAGLGAELAEAAARNELSANELTDLLLTHDEAVLDTTGLLFYAEGPVDTTGLEPAVAQAGPYPYGDTFLLHSKPDATRKIFLDFDGHTVTGTQWQSDFPTIADPFIAAPFSLDADPAFSNAELDAIQSIWQRVAEDYAPYDIDVTTQDPGAAGINRASSGDVNFGTRVLITGSATFGGISTTGIAYIGTIDAIGVNHDRTQPAWVFANGVNNDTKNIAETASHEAGHNVGLLHDGQGLSEYYHGHTPWAPIMGVGFSQPIVQFSRGEYSGASRTEDDLLVITQNNVPNRADDHTNNTSTATPLVDVQAGVISSQADYDAFAYVATATGPVTIIATPAPVSPNLDIVLSIFDSTGGEVATSAPAVTRVSRDVATGLDASVTFDAAVGSTYYAQVSGDAFRTPSTGYSRYGSIGQYTVTVADAPAPSSAAWPDFDGNGRADRSVFRPSSGGWHIDGATTTYLGLSGDDPVPADYDGDGTTDRAVFRNGQWYIAGQPTRYLGALGDIPVPGDYDGDGSHEPAVYRDGAWFIEGQPTRYLGSAGDIPVPGDYDGDGTTDLAVYRPAVGGWYVEGAATAFFGLAGDVPVPGDYDGDGSWDRAVFRPQFGGWYVQGQTTQYLGLGGDTPTPSDYDGDGVTDRSVYRPAVGGWYVQDQPTAYLGLSTDIPLALPNAIFGAIR